MSTGFSFCSVALDGPLRLCPVGDLFSNQLALPTILVRSLAHLQPTENEWSRIAFPQVNSEGVQGLVHVYKHFVEVPVKHI